MQYRLYYVAISAVSCADIGCIVMRNQCYRRAGSLALGHGVLICKFYFAITVLIWAVLLVILIPIELQHAVAIGKLSFDRRQRVSLLLQSFIHLVVNYSYLMASMGSRRAAFLAGYQPKNTPVKVQTAKLMTIVQGSMAIGQ